MFTQSKCNIPKYGISIPLSLDIIFSIINPNIEIPHLDDYNGKGDPTTHVNNFKHCVVIFPTIIGYDKVILYNLLRQILVIVLFFISLFQ